MGEALIESSVADKIRTFEEVGVAFDGGKMGIGKTEVRIFLPDYLAEKVASALPQPREKITLVDTTSFGQPADLVVNGGIQFNGGFIAPNASIIIGRYHAGNGNTENTDELVRRIAETIKSHSLTNLNPQFNDSHAFSSVREMGFFSGPKPISPADIFKGYDGLKFLIDWNTGGLDASHDRVTRESFVWKQAPLEEVVDRYKRALPKDIIAVAKTDDGRITPFEVQYRTNFRKGMTKEPNVVYLIQDSFVIVMRVGRTYDEEFSAPQLSKYRGHINKHHYLGLLTGSHQSVEIDMKKFLFLPEPYLLAALENLYLEGTPRITPNLKVVETDNGDVYYLRTWVKSLRDLPLDSLAVARYLGTAQGYGLFEDKEERQVVHYCYQPTEDGAIIVNIDPDLMLNRLEKPRHDADDTNDFLAKLMEVHPLGKEEARSFKREVSRRKEELAGDSLVRRLVGAIPPSLYESSLSKLTIPAYNPTRIYSGGTK